MKNKRNLFALLFMLVSLLLVSCMEKHTGGQSDWTGKFTMPSYFLTVDVNNNSDVVKDLPKSGYYEAGHKFEFYIQVVTDVEFYASLNGKRFTYPPSDATVGAYCKYSFEMPKENSNLKIDVLTSDIIYLKYVYDWINDIKLEDISMVFFCDKNYSIAPSFYMLDRIYYSDDENDLKNVYDYLNNTYLQGVNYDLRTGVETKTMCIVTKNGDKYVLSTYDGTIYNQGLNMIISKNLPSFYNGFYGYSFPGNSLFSIKALDSLDSNTDVTSYFKNMDNLRNMIFKEVNNVSFDTSINDYNRYKFTNYLGEIIFETEEYFKVNTEGIIKTYQIINEYKFSSLK